MLDTMRYINSKGQILNFGSLPYLINYNDLRDFVLPYTTDSNSTKIQSFERGITEKSITIVILNNAGCTEAKNNLFNVLQYDTAYQSNGKLFIGDYYMEGYFIGSEKANYLESNRFAVFTLKFISEDGTWKKITSGRYVYSGSSSGETEPFLTYPYDYPYDYKAGTGVLLINNPAAFESEFVIRIFGHVVNPTLTIGNIDYKVTTTVYTNEYLVINSKEKTVVRYQPDGTAIDEFNNRDREFNIFTKIPSGINTLRHNVANGIEIDLIDERSEPLWISS